MKHISTTHSFVCVCVCTYRRGPVVWACQSAARPTGMAAARSGSTAWFWARARVSVCDCVWSPVWSAAPPEGQDCRPHRAVPTALGPWTATDSDASEETRTKPGWVYTHTHTHRLSSSSQLGVGDVTKITMWEMLFHDNIIYHNIVIFCNYKIRTKKQITNKYNRTKIQIE